MKIKDFINIDSLSLDNVVYEDAEFIPLMTNEDEELMMHMP